MVQELRDIAFDYLRQRHQAPSPKSEVAFELALIAYLTFDERNLRKTEKREELAQVLGNPTPSTHLHLCAALIEAGVCAASANIVLAEIDSALLGDAAARAWSKCRGGDYADAELYIAVPRLIDTYEWATGERATYSSRAVGEVGASGAHSQISGSPCGKFILDFFKRIRVRERSVKISSILRAELRSRQRRKSAQSFPRSR